MKLFLLSIVAIINSADAVCTKKPPVNFAPAGSIYVGCFPDTSVASEASPHALPNQFATTAGDEINSCYNIALSQHASYFGLQKGNLCFTGGYSANVTKYGLMVPNAQCDMPCGSPTLPRVTGSKMCGSDLLSSVFFIDGFKALSAPVVASTSDYTYVGCYIDSGFAHAIPGLMSTSNGNVVGSCRVHAVDHHATYFAIQNGRDCYFGGPTTQFNYYGPMQSEDDCNIDCGGNINYIDGPKCGGNYRNAVYKMKSITQVPIVSYPQYTYVGCFQDYPFGDATNRLLANVTTISGALTGSDVTFACYQGAKANNNQYFGTQNGNLCYSGLNTTVLTKYGSQRSESECSNACGPPIGTDFGTGPKCGGNWHNSVYKVNY